MHSTLTKQCLLCAVLSLAACGPDAESTEVAHRRDALVLLSVEAETLGSPATDATASGGAAMMVYTPVSAVLSPGAAGASATFRVRRGPCGTSIPLVVKVAGVSIGTLTLASETYATMTLTASLPASAVWEFSHGVGCRAYVDTIVIEGPTAPPPPTTLVLQAESATGAGAIVGNVRRFSSNGTATLAFTTTGSTTQLVARAMGKRCNLTVPRLVLTIDGTTYLDQAVSTTSLTNYPVALSLPAGAHTLGLTYPNNADVPPCDSSLDVDSVTLTVQP
ncbi:MAG: hypothetical protein ACOZQL_36655 [Myxococcota bacterium]